MLKIVWYGLITLASFYIFMETFAEIEEANQTETVASGADSKKTLPYPINYGNKKVKNANACLFILCRNSDLADLIETLINFEDKFNHKHDYPYIIVNDKPFTSEFELAIRNVVKFVEFGLVPKEHWQYPAWIDLEKAETSRIDLKKQKVLYGDSESYRFMCRYFSGFFFKHPLITQFEYYWRIEPGVKFTCDIDYDPFVYMLERNLDYGFTIALKEIPETIPTLWKNVVAFVRHNMEFISKENNNIRFMVSEDGKYNNCHFWSNFEIAKLSFFNSPQYQSFFSFLDQTGGFFYERWGDAPIHSIATALFLKKDQVFYFEDIGYLHPPFGHCPSAPSVLKKCQCDPKESFDWTPSSCLRNWLSS